MTEVGWMTEDSTSDPRPGRRNGPDYIPFGWSGLVEGRATRATRTRDPCEAERGNFAGGDWPGSLAAFPRVHMWCWLGDGG